PPGIPSGLQSGTITPMSITLQWNASSDNDAVKEYLVFLDNTLVARPAATTYTAEYLQQCSSYEFAVAARDFSGNTSDKSEPLTLQTDCPNDTQKPSQPVNIRAPGITISSVSLAWDASSDNVGVTGYDIYNGTAFLATVSNPEFTYSNMQPGDSLIITIVAKDGAGNVSDQSTVFKTAAKTIPSVSLPFSVNIGGNNAGDFLADKAWFDNSDYGYTPGGSTKSSDKVVNTSNDAVYKVQRYRQFGYRVRVPHACTYDIRLMFCELNPNADPGARRFKVFIDGQSITGDYIDVSSEVGIYKPYDITMQASCGADRLLNFAFTAANGNPILNGLSIDMAEAYAFTMSLDGKQLLVDDPLSITWKTNVGIVDDARLWVSPDSGSTWAEITENSIKEYDSTWQNYQWNVPAAIGNVQLQDTYCILKITDYDKIKKAFSDGYFLIKGSSAIDRRRLSFISKTTPFTITPSFLLIHNHSNQPALAELISMQGDIIWNRQVPSSAQLQFDFSLLSQGAYILRMHIGGDFYLKKIVAQK
ncbi:MAG: hypothetical protein GF401_02780, partial [Chitinivibrionales bacterium]|nr:hypothetical protein [Chitinivibrionales bacterium]